MVGYAKGVGFGGARVTRSAVAIKIYLNDGKRGKNGAGYWTWDTKSQPKSQDLQLLEVRLSGERSGTTGQILADENVDLGVSYVQLRELIGEGLGFSS